MAMTTTTLVETFEAVEPFEVVERFEVVEPEEPEDELELNPPPAAEEPEILLAPLEHPFLEESDSELRITEQEEDGEPVVATEYTPPVHIEKLDLLKVFASAPRLPSSVSLEALVSYFSASCVFVSSLVLVVSHESLVAATALYGSYVEDILGLSVRDFIHVLVAIFIGWQLMRFKRQQRHLTHALAALMESQQVIDKDRKRAQDGIALLASKLSNGSDPAARIADANIHQELAQIASMLRTSRDAPRSDLPSDVHCSMLAMLANICEGMEVSYSYPKNLTSEIVRWGWVGTDGFKNRLALLQRVDNSAHDDGNVDSRLADPLFHRRSMEP
ncbi:MAG: uncharacterized protein KVP18_000635 [Porospora cf. gigantea A]|uniref:uncharacterized protein n=1 Tax=Porospora cf. gigantea A TaxID=2853593 RepID=UPI00355A8341|nr:MAG: hypothetical protein KVP18_000635 [Porospora cf. gigantea A]